MAEMLSPECAARQVFARDMMNNHFTMNNRADVFFVRRTTGRRLLQPAFYKPVQAVPILCLLFAITGCAPSKPLIVQPNGKALYATYCVSCHGADGRNDRSSALPAMRLSAANSLFESDWNHLVLNGRGQMPAFQNRLSSAQLDALRAYVRQLTVYP